eukprot:CAMPEP_0167763856 /NCGR_PEP_ID=MMETSP0110_2-20121227/13651_1 /TAXON_ID=629695 /ORGANISM="Gymnochlora sp., Strain CCMP2014" /LENGTH=79 /DNA_ID=CAMNT_0007651079 /DNA_START=230 /DNA_END=469 /DNA_ORIENTATION=-
MEEAQDIWETSDGAWIPRVVLGTTSYQLDESMTKQYITKKVERVSKECARLKKEYRVLKEKMTKLRPKIIEWFGSYMDE